MILTRVEDLLHGSGDAEFEENVMKPLKTKFLFGSEEESEFLYVGMQVSDQRIFGYSNIFEYFHTNIFVFENIRPIFSQRIYSEIRSLHFWLDEYIRIFVRLNLKYSVVRILKDHIFWNTLICDER